MHPGVGRVGLLLHGLERGAGGERVLLEGGRAELARTERERERERER